MTSLFNQIMLNIQRGHYIYLGSGSSRDVYDLGNGYVIKMAKNWAGIAQNKCEYKISSYDNSGLFAKVIKASEDFSFLIMEKAKKVKHISEIWDYFNVASKRELIDLMELQNIKKKYNLLLGDFVRKNNWGIINGRPTIIDYGFTREVNSIYY